MSRPEKWVRAADGSGRAHLFLAAQRELDAEIREEKAGRSEALRLWIALGITGLTGVIGGAK
jgi:hypothetical protein